MTAPSATESIELEVRVKARPETVFPLISTAQGMARWFGSTAELDARPGGTLRVDINGRDIARGEIRSLEENRRVVFSFGWEGEGHPVPAGSTTVEISLAEDGEGTLVRLRHTDLPAEQAAGHKEGWEHYLPRLVMVAEGGDPGRDPWAVPGE